MAKGEEGIERFINLSLSQKEKKLKKIYELDFNAINKLINMIENNFCTTENIKLTLSADNHIFINEGNKRLLKVSIEESLEPLTDAFIYAVLFDNLWLHTCKNCGYSYSDTYTTPKSHHFDEGVILQSPTLTSNGYIMYTCLECGTTINQVMPKLKPDALKNQSVISSDTVKAGDEIVLTAKAEGGIGEYRYAAYYKSDSSTSWKTIQNFNSNANIYTQIYQKGSYQICIKVKDGAGTIAKNYYDITVLPCDPLKNVSVISSTSANVGETITARCLALNGTGNYKYAVYKRYRRFSKRSNAFKQKHP